MSALRSILAISSVLEVEFHPHAMKPLPTMFQHLLAVCGLFSVIVCVSVDNSIHKFPTTELCVLFYGKENMLPVFRHELKRTWTIKYLARWRMSVEFCFHISLHSLKWNIHTCMMLLLPTACVQASRQKPSSLRPSVQYWVSNRYKHELYLN